MKRPGFAEGVAVAIVASLACGVLFSVLAPLAGGHAVLRILVALAGLAYVLSLLGRSGARVGRVAAVLAWCAGAGAIAWFAPSLPAYLAGHLVMAWLVRSLFFHAGLPAALADLGITAFGLAAAAFAFGRTGSVFAAAWCLFLVQALFAFIPARETTAMADEPGADRFDRAYRAAEAAVRRLSETT